MEGKRVRVYVNGAEVTDRCTDADDSEGWADLLRHRAGRPYLNANGEVARERVTGVVAIVFEERA